MDNSTISYWPVAAQAKKDPISCLSTRACEEIIGATSLANHQQQGTPSDQEPDPRSQHPRQRSKKIQRNYQKMNWTLEEKKIILYCFTYSRYEKWGRNKNKIFHHKRQKPLQCIVSQLTFKIL